VLMESDGFLSQVEVEGEISNFKRHSSGHLYFTLKDDESRVSCVMFRGQAFSLRFEPSDGMAVRVYGRVSVYEKNGAYQIYVSAMRKSGSGDLYERYQKLLKKLSAEGLFDESRKKPLPFLPRRIALVTSPTGAAVRDMISVLSRRAPYAALTVCPVLVQGEGAAQSIVEMLRRINDDARADVILLGRGGGSIEELWAFNEEPVARAIYASRIPVVSCVGHETDFTVADFAADLRAPTPSAAAELAAPDAAGLMAEITGAAERMERFFTSKVNALSDRLKSVSALPVMKSPEGALDARAMALDELSEKLDERMNVLLRMLSVRLSSASGLLESVSVEKTLRRGFFIPVKDGKAVTPENIAAGDEMSFIGSGVTVDVNVREVRGEGDGRE